MDRFTALITQLHQTVPALELREQEPMNRHTSFRIGGPVRLLALPRTAAEAQAALRAAAELELSPFFLGNGTNLLVADGGWAGFAIQPAGELCRIEGNGSGLTAGGGALLSRLAGAALDRGLAGLEFAQGIPGTVGGAVTMNAGAYGGELAQIVSSVTVLEQGKLRVLGAEQCGFGYRKSAFSDGTRLIVEASFALRPGDRGAIKARMEELAARRREKQPLELPSAGSTFKRPEGHFAAALIEQCGLKGVGIGGAQVSEKHAGFVVNRGGATAEDVRRLMELVQETVLRETGVALEPEVKFLGFDAP